MRLNPALVLCLLLTACARDAIDTPGTWQAPPKGFTSNDENLRAMLVNPRDIVSGRGEDVSVASTSAAAANRLITGRRRALLNSGTSRAVQASGGESQTPAAAPGAGTGARTE